MQQGPNRAEAKERLYQTASFFGKSKDDPRLNELMNIYFDKVDQIPEPKSRIDKTKYVIEWMDEIEEDSVIHEDKWWTRNSLYLAENSRTGFTKNEWEQLRAYITNEENKN